MGRAQELPNRIRYHTRLQCGGPFHTMYSTIDGLVTRVLLPTGARHDLFDLHLPYQKTKVRECFLPIFVFGHLKRKRKPTDNDSCSLKNVGFLLHFKCLNTKMGKKHSRTLVLLVS